MILMEFIWINGELIFIQNFFNIFGVKMGTDVNACEWYDLDLYLKQFHRQGKVYIIQVEIP